MKKLVAIAVLTLALAACGQGSEQASSGQPNTAEAAVATLPAVLISEPATLTYTKGGKDDWQEQSAAVGTQHVTGAQAATSVFKIATANNFGGHFASPDNHLRILVKNGAGATSWAWVNQEHIQESTAYVPGSAFIGSPLIELGEITNVEVGGWAEKGAIIQLSGVELVAQQ